MIFVPIRIKESQGNMYILGALHFVQAQTGMRLINGFQTIFNTWPSLLTSMPET
jgi:hypothetical protein